MLRYGQLIRNCLAHLLCYHRSHSIVLVTQQAEEKFAKMYQPLNHKVSMQKEYIKVALVVAVYW